MTRAERRFRALLVAHAIWSALLACGYVASGDTGTFAFIANSFAKDMLFVMLSAVAAAHVRRYGWLALVIAAGYVALVIGQIATLAWGTAPALDVLGIDVAASTALGVWMAVDLLLALLFAASWAAAVRSRWELVHLHPAAFHTVVAVAEVTIEGDHDVAPPQRIAKNVDDHLSQLAAADRRRIQRTLIATGLWPLLTLRPPLPALTPESRWRFLDRHKARARTATEMAYVGYFGDRPAEPSADLDRG